MSRIGKHLSEGKVTRNPFFNFLRQFRKDHNSLNMIQTAVEGGKEWYSMGRDQKQPFYELAQKAPKVVPKMRRLRNGRRIRYGNRQRLF